MNKEHAAAKRAGVTPDSLARALEASGLTVDEITPRGVIAHQVVEGFRQPIGCRVYPEYLDASATLGRVTARRAPIVAAICQASRKRMWLETYADPKGGPPKLALRRRFVNVSNEHLREEIDAVLTVCSTLRIVTSDVFLATALWWYMRQEE